MKEPTVREPRWLRWLENLLLVTLALAALSLLLGAPFGDIRIPAFFVALAVVAFLLLIAGDAIANRRKS